MTDAPPRPNTSGAAGEEPTVEASVLDNFRRLFLGLD